MKILLPIVSLLNITNWLSDWDITKILFGIQENNYKVTGQNDTLEVFYPKGSYSPSKDPVGGLGFFSSPKEVLMSEHLVLSYQFKFNDNFEPIYGGKLPGLFLSRDKFETKGSAGGKIRNNTASIRLAWRKHFDAEVYVYLPKNQHEEYFQIQGYRSNGKFGHSLWRTFLNFDKTNWNNVTLEVKLNTINENNVYLHDGFMSITINDKNYSFDKFVFRESNETMISSFLFDTFFGGSTIKYATPVDTSIFFKNITLEKIE